MTETYDGKFEQQYSPTAKGGDDWQAEVVRAQMTERMKQPFG